MDSLDQMIVKVVRDLSDGYLINSSGYEIVAERNIEKDFIFYLEVYKNGKLLVDSTINQMTETFRFFPHCNDEDVSIVYQVLSEDCSYTETEN